MKIAIASTCAPFKGEKNIIQRAALDSWSHQPNANIYLLGKDDASEAICDVYPNFKYLPTVLTAKHIGFHSNAILLDDAFQVLSINLQDEEVVVWINSDIIILENDLSKLLYVLKNEGQGKLVAWSRRRNLANWRDCFAMNYEILLQLGFNEFCEFNSTLQTHSGIDGFFFDVEFFKNLWVPRFVVNAWFSDDYFRIHLPKLHNNVKDLSKIVKLIHPNHDVPIQKNPEWQKMMERNRELREKYQ